MSIFTEELVDVFLHPVQSAISVLSSLTAVAPDYLDSLANLGVAYIQRFEILFSVVIFFLQTLILHIYQLPVGI